MAVDTVVVDAPVATETTGFSDEPREELGDVCVRGSRKDPEPSEEFELQPVVGQHVALRPFLPRRHLAPMTSGRWFHPDRVVQSRDGLVHQGAQHREAIGAPDAQGRDEWKVVDAADHRVDFMHPHIEEKTHCPGQTHQLVAQPDRRHRRLAGHRTTQCREGVADVYQQGARAAALHGPGDANGHRNAPQCTRDAAGTNAVAHRLAQAIAIGNLKVVAHGVEATNGEPGDHELGAVQRGVELRRGARPQAARHQARRCGPPTVVRAADSPARCPSARPSCRRVTAC